ncbi:MAG: DUF975 family protein [Treponema sp.]|nr:DUF975 family protein [Treponema sp.]
MFDRQKYKKIAKMQLKGRRSVTVLATLTVVTVVFLMYLPDKIRNYRQVLFGLVYPKQTPLGNALSFLVPVLVYFIYGVMFMAYSYLHIVMSHTTKEVKFSTYIHGYTFWLQGFLGYLWQLLWTTLWSFLFVIPGIVKHYAYSQMFFIMAENPDIPVRKAMRMSILMTNGHKADLFKMDLSLLGWYILIMMTSGFAALWFGPYIMMTKVNAFHALKEEALRVGVLERYDFGDEDSAEGQSDVAVKNKSESSIPAEEKTEPVSDVKASGSADYNAQPARASGEVEYTVLDEPESDADEGGAEQSPDSNDSKDF